MTHEGLFFILTAANTLLCNDLGYSYKIASATSFSVAVNRLFTSNITRFHSLSCMKLYQHAVTEGGDPIDNLKLLLEAIQAVYESMDKFQGDQSKGEREIRHGMALCKFQKGYIYHKFGDKLGQISEKFSGNQKLLMSLVEDEKHTDYILGNEALCKQFAYTMYEEAYQYFYKINHLKGMAVCKRLMAEV